MGKMCGFEFLPWQMVWWCCLTPMFCHLPSRNGPIDMFLKSRSVGSDLEVGRLIQIAQRFPGAGHVPNGLRKRLLIRYTRTVADQIHKDGCWSDTQGEAPQVMLLYKAIDSDIPEFPRKRYRAHRVPAPSHSHCKDQSKWLAGAIHSHVASCCIT